MRALERGTALCKVLDQLNALRSAEKVAELDRTMARAEAERRAEGDVVQDCDARAKPRDAIDREGRSAAVQVLYEGETSQRIEAKRKEQVRLRR